MMESNMMVVAPKLERYPYTTLDQDDSIDSDDEKFNYVIDLDYKEEDSTESENDVQDAANDCQGTENSDAQKPITELEQEAVEDKVELNYNYTIKGESGLDLRNTETISKSGQVKDVCEDKQAQGKDSNFEYVLEHQQVSGKDINKMQVGEQRTMLTDKTTTVNTKINGAHLAEVVHGLRQNGNDEWCNKLSAEGSENLVSKPSGASKRKRKFSLENAITNIIKAKTVCTRDLSYNDNNIVEQASSFSPSSSASSTSPTSLASNHSRVENIHDQHFMDLSVKSSQMKTNVSSLSPLSNCSRTSPTSAISLSSVCSPVSSYSTSLSSSKISSCHPVPVNTNMSSRGFTDMTQKPLNRRKSAVVFRCDKSVVNGNDCDALDMTIKKEKETIKSHKPVSVFNPDEVMDLSKPSKDEKKISGAGDLVKNEPVDLRYNSAIETKPNVKKEPNDQESPESNQLKVIDIFKDMLAQKDEGNGTVSMQQFVEWMQKIQPMAIEKMDMMQLSAYYMQFTYWMQTFYNNALMSRLPVQNGVNNFLHQKKSRQNNGRRKSLPTPFAQSNSMPKSQTSDTELNRFPQSFQVDEKIINKEEKTFKADISDYNSNNVKLENIDFRSCPDISTLKERYGCQVSDRDGKIKFMVKDNEEILAICNCIVQVGDLQESELDGLERDENGLCPLFICRICDQKFFHLEHLSKHVKTSHIQKRFQCAQCERSFHDAGNYRQHIRVHDETDIPYECPECNRRFRHKCTLKVHMRIHTGEKPFKCDVCEATFKISSGLQTHMRKHTGETPYACEFCSLRFKCQSNLKQHLFQHTQARPFPCEICGKSYSRKSIRDSHVLTHYRNSPMSQDLNVTI